MVEMPSKAAVASVVMLIALAAVAVVGMGENLALAQSSGNSTKTNSTGGSTNSTAPPPAPAAGNTTAWDLGGTCTVSPAAGNWHYCDNVKGAQQLGMASTAGVIALSVGLGVAGLRYRYPPS